MGEWVYSEEDHYHKQIQTHTYEKEYNKLEIKNGNYHGEQITSLV